MIGGALLEIAAIARFDPFMKRLIVSGLALCLLPACASSGPANDTTSMDEAAGSAMSQTRAGLGDAALAPLEDFNLKRDAIPPELDRLTTPYGAPAPLTCANLAAEVRTLNALLGDDWDTPHGDEEEPDRAQWAADKSAEAALGAVESGATGWIPFRGLVREATGAAAHAKRRDRAFRVGAERRAFLKGVGTAMKCDWPAAPLDQIADPGAERIEYHRRTP